MVLEREKQGQMGSGVPKTYSTLHNNFCILCISDNKNIQFQTYVTSCIILWQKLQYT